VRIKLSWWKKLKGKWMPVVRHDQNTHTKEVEVIDDGGGPFLAIKGRNLEPNEDYDPHTVTLAKDDIEPLCEALKGLL